MATKERKRPSSTRGDLIGPVFCAILPDSEAMGFLLQITMSCPCALSRQVAGAGALSWLCRVAVPVLRGGDRLLVLVPGARAGCWVPLWRCRKLAAQAAHILFQPVACEQVVEFCLAIWVYAGVIFFSYERFVRPLDSSSDALVTSSDLNSPPRTKMLMPLSCNGLKNQATFLVVIVQINARTGL